MMAQTKVQAQAVRSSAARPAFLARAGARSSRKPSVQVRAEVATSVVDVVAINKKLEARAKALIALEEQELSMRPKVKFSLQKKVGLGESWKIVGDTPELGRMVPEVAPYMQWNNGDVWTLEVPLRFGQIKYKAVLRKADGAYVWESGDDRSLQVEDNTSSAPLGEVKFPSA